MEHNGELTKQEKARLSDYLSLMPLLSSKTKVLDLGSGKGYVSKYIRNHYNCEVWCIDIKRPECSTWIDEFKKYGINFIYCDIAKSKALPFPANYFDLVPFLEVLEHLITSHPPWQLFREINRVLKKGGYLILSTPNIAELIKRIRLLFGKHPVPRLKNESEFYVGHYREYTLKELLYILDETGFKVEKVRMRVIFTQVKRC